MSHEFDIPRWLRYKTPLPRDVEVIAQERHCESGCAHLAESYRRGWEVGARAERERHDGHSGTLILVAVWSFIFGVMAAVTIRLAVLLLG
jgi:hypothetical protein